MTPPLQDRAPYRSLIIAVVALLALVLVAVLLVRGGDGDDTAPDSPSGSPTQSSPTPTLPPAPAPPVSVVDEASLTLPEELRAADGSFYLERGTSYLASFEVSTVKPPDEPGLAMYLGITFSCTGADGGTSEWIGGTENLLVDQPVTYRNQLLLEPQQSQVVSCSVRANAPYDDVAAAGATIDLDITWSVRAGGDGAVSTPSEQRLPMTIGAGEREVVFLETLPVGDAQDRQVQLLSSLHVTTCTVVNGSREAGRTWCEEDDLDERGSDFDVELRVDVLDETGERCGSVGAVAEPVQLPLERHHQLVSRDEVFDVSGTLCGPMLRTAVVVDNRGPASLVVHESNSSLITLAP